MLVVAMDAGCLSVFGGRSTKLPVPSEDVGDGIMSSVGSRGLQGGNGDPSPNTCATT